MNNQSLAKITRRFFIFLGMLLLPCMSYGQTKMAGPMPPILQGSIHIQPAQPVPGDQTGKIQPGKPVKLAITVENKGEQKSPPGQLSIRFGLVKPLDKEATSVIFKTEQKALPEIGRARKSTLLLKKYMIPPP